MAKDEKNVEVTEEQLLKSLEALEKSIDEKEEQKEDEEVNKVRSKTKDDMKKGDEEDDENKDDENEDEDEESEKSLAKKIEENETLSEGFEVSDFLKSLTTEVATHVDALGSKIATDKAIMLKSLTIMSEAMTKIAKSVESVTKRMDALEKETPAMKKSVTAKPQERFEKSEDIEKSDRSTVMKHLERLGIEGKISPVDVALYENRGVLSKSAKDAIAEMLKK